MRLFARFILLALLTACASSKPKIEDPKDPVTDPEPKDVPPSFTAGPEGFPLPLDATDAGEAPGGGGKIVMYAIARPGADVADELRALLAADGWTIDSEEVSPRGAIRWDVSKGDVKINARLVGDDTQSQVILTLP